MQKKNVKIFFTFLFFSFLNLYIYIKYNKNEQTVINQEETDDAVYNSNIIKEVEYTTKDKDGNEYYIKAEEGEIDFSNPNIIFLKKVSALIKLIESDEVTIFSDFGKYNSENYDIFFQKMY